MPNPNPYEARLSLKKQRKSGSLADAQLIQWRALKAAEDALYSAGEANNLAGVFKAVHAITQASTAYAKLVEVGELEARLGELERQVEARPERSDATTPASTNGRAYA